jgi:hypothetical protein
MMIPAIVTVCVTYARPRPHPTWIPCLLAGSLASSLSAV